MDTAKDNVLREEQPESSVSASSVASASPVADSAMATGTDDEPEMTIADKHAGDTVPDLDGDGNLTTNEAARLLGEKSSNK